MLLRCFMACDDGESALARKPMYSRTRARAGAPLPPLLAAGALTAAEEAEAAASPEKHAILLDGDFDCLGSLPPLHSRLPGSCQELYLKQVSDRIGKKRGRNGSLQLLDAEQRFLARHPGHESRTGSALS